jgi:membrane-bound lytic murein transglycosylase B
VQRLLQVIALTIGFAFPAFAEQSAFEAWRDSFKESAILQGISKETAEKVMGQAFEDASVVHLDRKQPEGKISFTQYRKNILSADRIQKGRKFYQAHRALLAEISAHYGVPAKIIVALWGIETNYGSYTGNFNIIPSLATLAYEGRRAEFFQGELLAAMKMVEQGADPYGLQGSWAGAMGQCQFMPSSFLKYAVDYDKDGRKDIWNSLPDVFASIANYLKTEGWKSTLTWGRPVQMPSTITLSYETLYTPVKLSEFMKRGVRKADGSPLPARDIDAYLMHPGTPNEGAFIVYQNYHVLLHWNKSRYFATSVGLLADAIAQGSE